MPEMSDLRDWSKVNWDNMVPESGCGIIDRRPYYFKVCDTGKKTLVLISAVPSRTVSGALSAKDYLRLDYEGFQRLVSVGQQVFGKLC